jgi:uncharacterized membrane protein YjjP (DUF1212 family)
MKNCLRLYDNSGFLIPIIVVIIPIIVVIYGLYDGINDHLVGG